MLTSRFGFGYGMGYAAYKEAAALVSLGHAVTVVHCYSSPEIAHFYDPRIIRIYLPMMRIPLIGFLMYEFKLKSFFRKKLHIEDFDSIYIQSLEFGLLNLSRVDIPIFYYARSTMLGLRQTLKNEGERLTSFAKIIHWILVALERRCMRYSKMIFVKSRKMISEISRLYHINPNKLTVISGGIDDKDFQMQSKSSCEAFKRKFKIPLNVPLVLYAGRIVPQKGLFYLVEASLRLLREADFAVVIAGADVNKSYYTKIKQQLDHTTYQKFFYFLGHIDQRDVSLVLNSADCVVTPSLYEPFGMVNLQAAFLNKSIITTDVTGSINLLAKYEKMKVVPAGSSTAIESALRETIFLKSKKYQTSFDFRSYSWLHVAEQLTQYFLASQRKRFPEACNIPSPPA